MVDAEGAELGAASTGRAGVENRLPLVEFGLVESRRTGQPAQEPAGQGVVLAVQASDQVRAVGRIVLRVLFAVVDRANLGAGAALGTHVHVQAQRPRTTLDGVDRLNDRFFICHGTLLLTRARVKKIPPKCMSFEKAM